MSSTNHHLRIATAFGVLLFGVLTALLFRRDPPQVPSAPHRGEPLILRRQKDLPQWPVAKTSRPPVPEPEAGLAVTWSPNSPPPMLPREYPNADGPRSTRQGTTPGPHSGESLSADGEPLRTHKVVDGDTLSTLAMRYFGSADWTDAIYRANRDLLQSPQLLPIGAELRIPTRGDSPIPSQRRLVPLTPS